MKNKKLTLKRLFENDNFVRAFAVFVAVVCWIGAALTDGETRIRVIGDVPVNLKLQENALSNLGLNVIEGQEQLVDVKVSGYLTDVGNLKPKDLSLTAKISNVTEPGSYELEIIPAQSSSEMPFQIVSISPPKVRVKLDRLNKKTFDIEPIVNGMSFAPGFTLGKYYTNPKTVTVSGPQAELAKVVKCVVTVDLTEPLSKSFSKDLPIQLLDISGQELDPLENHLILDNDEAQMVIQTLQETELPLEVGFLNIPKEFPVDELRDSMMMTKNSVPVAGPPDVLQNITEIRLGEIDIKSLRPDSNYTFNVDMPEPADQFTRLDTTTSVGVTFDDLDWTTMHFNISNIVLVNEPKDYSISVISQTLYNVEFAGRKDILEEMTADDIVAEVDLSKREIAAGSQKFPVLISAPTKGMVWAVGDYNAVIEVKKLEA